MSVGVALAALERQHTRADGRHHRLGREDLADHVLPADALQAGDREQQGVGLPGGHLRQAPVGVAAERHALQVRMRGGQLRDPAHRGGADPRSGRQLVEGEPARVDQGVPDVVPLEERGEHRARGERPVGGHVLHAVHGEIGLARQQRRVDLLGERALALDQGQIAHPLVAGGLHRHDLGAHCGMGDGQLGPDTLHLGQRHGRVAGDDADQFGDGHADTIDPPTAAPVPYLPDCPAPRVSSGRAARSVRPRAGPRRGPARHRRRGRCR